MVTDETSALTRLADLLAALTGLDDDAVLLGYGDGPKPTTSHLTLIPLANDGIGLPARRAGDVVHAHELQVLVTAYGAEALAGLAAAKTLLMSDAVEMFEALGDGLAVRTVSALSDQTALQHTSYEPRASLTVTCGYTTTTEAADPPEASSVSVTVNGTPDVIVEPPPEEASP